MLKLTLICKTTDSKKLHLKSFVLLNVFFAAFFQGQSSQASASIGVCKDIFASSTILQIPQEQLNKAAQELSELIANRTDLINQNSSRILIDVIDKKIKEKENEIQIENAQIAALVKKNQQSKEAATENEMRINPKHVELVPKKILDSESTIKNWRLSNLQLETGSKSHFHQPTGELFFLSDHVAGPQPLMLANLSGKTPTNSNLFALPGIASELYITPDRQLAIAPDTFWGHLRFYDLSTHKKVADVSLGKNFKRVEAFDPLKMLFILNEHKQLELYDYDGHIKIGFFNKDSHFIEGFHLDRKQMQLIIWGREPGVVSIYSLLTMDLVSQLELPPEITSSIKSITPLQGRDALFFEQERGPALLIDSLNAEVIQKYGNNETSYFAGKLSPDEKTIALSASDSGNSRLELYSLEGKILKKFKNETGLELQFSPGGKFLVASEAHWRTGVISIYDIHNLKKLKSESFQDMIFSKIYFNQDGSQIFANGSYLISFNAVIQKPTPKN